MATKVNEALARPARTAPQAAVAFAIVEFIDSFLFDMNERQYGAAVGVLVIAASGLQILAERGIGKAFLRSVPPRSVPIVDDINDSPEPNLIANAEIEVAMQSKEPDVPSDELFIADKYSTEENPYTDPEFDGRQDVL